MSKLLTLPVGVVVARETVDHPWQTERWVPVSVFLNPPDWSGWREMVRGSGFVQYHAANVELELHRKDTAAYQVNLTHGDPVVYVVLRECDDDEADYPVEVHTATVSPFDAQAHGYGGDEIVEGVAMPDRLRELVEAFVSEHHEEEKFVKRKREKTAEREIYQFGQEPIHELRRRMVGTRKH